MENEGLSLPAGIFKDIEDTPEGFAVFFSMITQGMDGEPLVLTEHSRKWTQLMYDSHENAMGTVVEAFRGAGKSVVSCAFVAWRIGHSPSLTNMVVRATHGAAKETGRVISGIIQHNPAWKLFFPYVIPDVGGSWNLNDGYNVIDTRVPSGQWAQIMAARGASKTLMVTALASKGIRGRRVSGVLMMDDLHQDEKSDSPIELNKVLSIFNEAIAPTRMKGCWTILIGTPIASNDLLQTLKALSGRYKSIKTPIEKSDGTPTWPEMFSKERIEQIIEEDITGGPGFAKEYMCDLSLMMSRVFDYQTYPADQINARWKKRGGLDYASIEGARDLKNRAHAAFAIITYNPDTGDWIVENVLVAQTRQSEIEGWIIDAQDESLNWEYTNIEIDGKGAEFYAICARNPGIRVKPEQTGGRGKQQRFERGLEPMLRTRRLKVSDGTTKGLMILRETLDNYPNVDKRGPGIDILDAVYWAVYDELLKPIRRQKRDKETKPKWYQVLAKHQF